MKGDRDAVLFRIDRKVGLLMLGVLAVVLGGFALSEQLTLTTSYPVPSGIYNQLITTGDSGSTPANTTFNRNAGNTILVPPTNASGNVGIGTAAPAAKLSVAGGVQLGDDTSACTAAKAGTQRWHAGATQVCAGGTWGVTSNLPSGTLTGHISLSFIGWSCWTCAVLRPVATPPVIITGSSGGASGWNCGVSGCPCGAWGTYTYVSWACPAQFHATGNVGPNGTSLVCGSVSTALDGVCAAN